MLTHAWARLHGMTLDQLALKHATDKSSHDHDYCRHYEHLLSPLPAAPFTLLEIGVAYGASLRMWAEWLPQATIIGLDNDADRPCWRGDPPRIQVIIGDQTSPHDLTLLKTHGPFQVIVDDGGHLPHQHLASFDALWPALSPGGWYIIEDLPTVFWPHVLHLPNILSTLWARLDSILRTDDTIQEIHIIAGSTGQLTLDGILLLRKRLT